MASVSKSSTAGVEKLVAMLDTVGHSEYSHVTLLGLETFDAVKLHDRVGKGLSYRALENLRQALDISTSQFAEFIWIPARTLARRKEAKRLQPDESDRLFRLSRIVGLALRLFEGRLPETRSWLLTPQDSLGGEVPLRFATSEVGAREVEHLIGRLEHGIPL